MRNTGLAGFARAGVRLSLSTSLLAIGLMAGSPAFAQDKPADSAEEPYDENVVIVTGTGHRTARSFDGAPAAAPLLHIDYR